MVFSEVGFSVVPEAEVEAEAGAEIEARKDSAAARV